jgi:hypothetical protein
VSVKTHTLVISIVLGLLLSACTPRIELAVPKEPITINLNVKIDHKIRIKIDKELDDLFDEENALF